MRGERLEPKLEARRDGAPDVGTVRRDAIERRRGAEVDDDGRRAVQTRGRERVDQPVRPDFRGPFDANGQRHRPGRGDQQRHAPPTGDGLDPGGEVRDDRGTRQGGDLTEVARVEPE